ncbi:hypothetical protein [Butyricicoccus sp.]|uniref:hypothetical protein n=1 Tax=Butyricicoccus sp. TaxID=2049021 RepID=UPI003AB06DF1
MMREYASNDEATRKQLAQERMEQAKVDFTESLPMVPMMTGNPSWSWTSRGA